MITFRRNSFSETSVEISYIENENAKDLLKRVVLENGYDGSDEILDHFQILINGLKIEKDLYPVITIKDTDEVLIAPELKRGEGAQIFKQIAIIAITVVATVFLGPAVGGGVYGALAVAAVSIGATLALNSLIPPPELPGLGGIGNLNAEESQMYAIASQSNAVKKFGIVPKVYGIHKMYPLIAANPYTELRPDPQNDRELIQYFNAVYDFGLGPLDIKNIKIGETNLSYFDEVEYALVDFNVPEEPEGIWDETLENKLQFYKGDVEREDVSYALNEDQYINYPTVISSDEGKYRAIRFAPPNITQEPAEIILDFICPQGLIAYATDGKTYDRSIELKIEFSNATGPEVWRPFNDLTFVKTFKTLGGIKNAYRDVSSFLPDRENAGNNNFFDSKWNFYFNPWDSAYYQNSAREYANSSTYTLKKGRTFIIVKGSVATTIWKPNDYIYHNGINIAQVASVVTYINSSSGYVRLNLKSPLKKTIELFTRTVYYTDPSETTISSIVYSVDNNSSALLLTKKVQSLGSIVVSDKVTTQKYFSVRFSPIALNNYKVRVTRVRTTSSATYSVRDNLTFISVLSRTNISPINTDKRHVFLDLSILATNQLNGAIQNLSAEVTSILPVYDSITQTWSKQPTNNPAWIFCDLLTGDVNPRPIPKSRLHMDSIVEWAEFCDEIPPNTPTKVYYDKRFTCNFILDFNTTLQQLINKVCTSAQASMNIIDGKYGVLIDKNKTIPVQIFTPRNSWDFTSTRNYSDTPQALKIRYVSPSKEWGMDEAIVYNTGYNVNNTTNYEEISSFACTSYEQAYRYGKYMLFQSILRQEVISINVDFEHLVCTRGDYVKISQDVMKVGGSPARIKSISGNVITIDDGIETTAVPYGYTYRGINGIETNTLTVINSTQFSLNGSLPSVGDLIVIGPVGNVTFDCLVRSISPNSDLSANLILVEKAEALYSYESDDDFPDYNPQINVNQDSENAAPPAVQDLAIIENSWRVIGGAYQYYIQIDWSVSYGVAIELFEVYVDHGTGYNLVGYTKESFYEYIVDPVNLNILHSFKILAVSANGKKISLIDAPVITATPIKKITPPSNVDGLFINITNQVIQLEWTRIFDVDLKEYLVRYSPDMNAIWETSTPLAKIAGASNSSSFQARTGSYFVKAIDLNGNQSLIAAKAITSIPNLFDLNFISETNDFPTLPGQLVTTEYRTDALYLKRLSDGDIISSEYYPEGYYYYADFLDLGQIYTCRLQSQVEAEGFTEADLMVNWNPLSEVDQMTHAGDASWDVETQYRGTDQIAVIANWTTMSSIETMSEGAQEQWTEWKKFTIGDFTFRIAQFRLKLISYKPNTTPRVYDGIIRTDMPDRFESYNNNISELTPKTITYDPSFAGPNPSPNIQVSIEDAESGDYYVISNKTLNGFDIIFYDKNNNPVIRQFDIAVKGYGRKALAVI